ncbi:MAG: methylated-DNA--[protein]-cysteine S-methyltransferase [Gemmatimonadota bacterium]
MSPTIYCPSPATVTIRFVSGQSSLGAVLVAWSELGICAVLFGDSAEQRLSDLGHRFPDARLEEGGAECQRELARVLACVDGAGLVSDLELDPQGTPLQRRVWRAIQQIPTGETTSYRQLADAVDAPGAARAVAQACGANPIAVLVPCHRVVRTDGGLSGYRWGVERKRELLRREQAG